MLIDHADLGVALSLLGLLGAGFVFVWANIRTTTLGESIKGLVALNDAQKAEIDDLRTQVDEWKRRYAELDRTWSEKYERLRCEFETFKAGRARARQ